MYRTTDGGSHWSKTGLEISGRLKDVQFLDPLNGWLTGEIGTLLYTDNGGDTWQGIAAGASASLLGVHFIDPQHGWIVGDRGVILSYAADRIPAGQPAVFSVANGASFLPGIASATWVAVFGENLSPSTRMWNDADFIGDKLPTQLDGVGVNINGKPAYPYYISPTQINVLVAADSAEGPVPVEVVTPQGAGDPFVAQKAAYSPGLFTFSARGGRYVIAHAPDGVWIGDYRLMFALGLQGGMRAAKPGEIVTLYGTGFGPADPPVSPGDLVTQPAALATPVTFRIGRTVAEVRWAGLIGSGLYQFNIRIPDVPDGDNVVVAELDGYHSQGDVVISVWR